MHTVWKGAISFGLVHVPVKMFSATEDKDISLRMLHSVCGSPIAYVKECPVCDRRIETNEIVKGYEYEKGRFVTFEKEELDQLGGEKSKTIQIIDFVALEEIDPIYFQKTYYLSPDQAGGGAYSLLMEAMKESGKIGIAKISIRSKSSLAAIRVLDGCLAIETIFYPDEIRPIQQVPNLPGAVALNDKELSMAKLLIDQLTTPFEPEKYTDDYRSAMHDLIQGKIAGEEVRIAPQQEPAHVLDLMAALQASLESVKGPAAAPVLDTGAADKPKKKGAKTPAAGLADSGEADKPAKKPAKPRAKKTKESGAS
ncbi:MULTISPECIES: Ku protein [unclassified Paenibacillus]|uniref:non-homologous end joining protein Ku n=1 Tax=unclassified Paenibacillus TaxID=185978 RepID=UPI0009543C1F|nr:MULTISPECIES: Ku protein [unclassified Paenibacillus]ASS69466.1 Ku protein [Paenibacillus sp. RUD330]SIR56966.1 DNA end-binding protein Ku [Paenibacillus sp. RU4X]SIR65675.1 DNA end-binding protein Ku [Paenibacillus sp. RU4T]